MIAQYWNEPVTVTLPGPNNEWTITATCFAAECLLTRWPDAAKGFDYFTASVCCAKAMNAECSQDVARRAFIRAAREARLLAVAHQHPASARF